VAVTLVEPTASVEVVNFASPPLSCAVPSTVSPTAKVTGPVGVTVGDVIVAVKVTACPDVDGVGDDVSVGHHLVQQRASKSYYCCTVCVTDAELSAMLESP
jgi:predicted small secreted protein